MLVKIENLIKRYDELVALDHFNLEVEKGEIYGLLGPNGSGKTTAINCMLSLLKFDKGKVYLFGEEMKSNKFDIKRKIGFVPQEVSVIEELTVRENIDFFCGLYINDEKKRAELVEKAIDFVGIKEFEKFFPNKLSGGLLRRLNIACGIAHEPELIIFDEPTVAVDPQSRNYILEGIRKLNEIGSTIIYTSHYMEEVELLCNRISIMDKGRVLVTGTKDELKNSVGLKDRLIVDEIELTPKNIEAIKAISGVVSAYYTDNRIDISIDKNHAIGNIINCLDELDIYYGKLAIKQPTLNDVFLEITGKELRESV